jgi:hypothetical protein
MTGFRSYVSSETRIAYELLPHSAEFCLKVRVCETAKMLARSAVDLLTPCMPVEPLYAFILGMFGFMAESHT